MNEIIAENVKVMFMFKIVFKMFFCNLHVLENEREDVFSFHELLKKRARLINKFNVDLV